MYEFEATVWRWREDGTWHFLTLPEDVTDDIDDRTPQKAGFGSVRVEATIGATTWRTSVFPEKATGAFVLPVKKPVRRAEDIDDGDQVEVSLTVLEG